MDVTVYGLTRKQAGVIFANVKSGKLNVPEGFVKFLYDDIADKRSTRFNNRMVTVFSQMKNGLDQLFSGELEEASATFTRTFNYYNATTWKPDEDDKEEA